MATKKTATSYIKNIGRQFYKNTFGSVEKNTTDTVKNTTNEYPEKPQNKPSVPIDNTEHTNFDDFYAINGDSFSYLFPKLKPTIDSIKKLVDSDIFNENTFKNTFKDPPVIKEGSTKNDKVWTILLTATTEKRTSISYGGFGQWFELSDRKNAQENNYINTLTSEEKKVHESKGWRERGQIVDKASKDQRAKEFKELDERIQKNQDQHQQNISNLSAPKIYVPTNYKLQPYEYINADNIIEKDIIAYIKKYKYNDNEKYENLNIIIRNIIGLIDTEKMLLLMLSHIQEIVYIYTKKKIVINDKKM